MQYEHSCQIILQTPRADSVFFIHEVLSITLVLLILVYSECYPGVPFGVHTIATEFVEHFFGCGRQLLPNFSYAEFLKMVQHIMVRQRILESGLVTGKHLKDSASGYLFNESTDLRSSSSESIPSVSISRYRIDELVKLAYDKAFHISRDILSIPAHKKPSFLIQPLLHSIGDMVAPTIEEDESQSDWESDEEVDEDSDDGESEDGDEGFTLEPADIDDVDPVLKNQSIKSLE